MTRQGHLQEMEHNIYPEEEPDDWDTDADRPLRQLYPSNRTVSSSPPGYRLFTRGWCAKRDLCMKLCEAIDRYSFLYLDLMTKSVFRENVWMSWLLQMEYLFHGVFYRYISSKEVGFFLWLRRMFSELDFGVRSLKKSDFLTDRVRCAFSFVEICSHLRNWLAHYFKNTCFFIFTPNADIWQSHVYAR